MDIRETLGQMTRGSTVTNGVFDVWLTMGGEFIVRRDLDPKPVFNSRSLKEVVEYLDSVRCPAPEAMAAPYPTKVAEAQNEMVPPTRLYGRTQRDVKLVDSVDIPNVGKLLEPRAPYGYVNTDGLKALCQDIHRYNVDAGWWTDINTGERLNRNVPEMLMLIVSEVSEAMEGYRKNLMDDKLPHRKMIEVELADALIRICDTAEGLGLDLAGAVQQKVLFNTGRSDHKIKNRLKEGGKKF